MAQAKKPPSVVEIDELLKTVRAILNLGAGVLRAARAQVWTEALLEDAALLGKLAVLVRKHQASVALAKEGSHKVTVDDARLGGFHMTFEHVLQDFKQGFLEEENALGYINAAPGISPDLVRKIVTVGPTASDSTRRVNLSQFIKECGSVTRAATRLVDAFGGRSGSAVEKARRAYPEPVALMQLAANARGGYVSMGETLRFALDALAIPSAIADDVVAQLRARRRSTDAPPRSPGRPPRSQSR